MARTTTAVRIRASRGTLSHYRSSLVGRRRPHQGVRYVPGPEARGGVLAVAAEEEGEVAVPGVLRSRAALAGTRGDAVNP